MTLSSHSSATSDDALPAFLTRQWDAAGGSSSLSLARPEYKRGSYFYKLTVFGTAEEMKKGPLGADLWRQRRREINYAAHTYQQKEALRILIEAPQAELENHPLTDKEVKRAWKK